MPAPEEGTSKIAPTRILPANDWQRARTFLNSAADLAGQDRARLIESEFSNEPRLRLDLISILDVYDRVKDAASLDRTSPPPAGPSERQIQIGKEYGPYRVIQLLGAGGMGQVFLARDLRLKRLVALKSLSGRWLDARMARLRLLQEAQTVAGLSHLNIAALYDVLEVEDYLLMVMEYVAGRTIAAEVGDGPLPLGHALRLAIQICDAMVYAHDRGVIHCDLKPSNVQVSPDGVAKVLDFGLARAKYGWYEPDAEQPERKPVLIGTPQYMPPERLLTGVLNVSGDIYSLGVMLFEMITAKRPFDEPTFAALTGAILGTVAPKPSSIVPSCPAGLDDIAARAMTKDPRQRYQTARELGRDLRDVVSLLDRETTMATFPMVFEPPVQSLFRRWFLPLLVLGTVLILTLIGFLTAVLYSSPIGLTMAFDGESPLWWPVWGVRALVVPLAQIGFTLVLLGIGTQLLRIVLALRPLQPTYARLSAAAAAYLHSFGSTKASTLAAELLAGQIVALVLFQWRFRAVLDGLNNFILQSGSLEALAPEHGSEHIWFVRVLALLMLGFGWSWYRLLKRRSQIRESIHTTTVAAGAVVLTLTFFLMVAPYRIFFQSKGERVLYQSRLCYLVGQNSREARLFCPLQSTLWNMRIDLQDPALVRTGITEKIFSPHPQK
jgi:serine/threonine protein kinase